MNRILILILLFPYFVTAQSITKYAGGGVSGTGNGGPATNAQLYLVAGVNIDKAGDLLICQQLYLRKVNSVTTIIYGVAGSDTATSAGGGADGIPATCAFLLEPYDVCVDKLGNMYVADYWYNKVRMVNATSGIITTYAGVGSSGSAGDGGPATSAKFGSGVVSVCIDTTRNYLYVSDEWNRKIRRIDMMSNIIATVAGTGVNGFSGDGGPASDANFGRVFGIELDKAGNLYIGDWDNHRIRKVDIESGIVTTIAGNGVDGYSGDNGPATAASLKKPAAICFDTCGNLYFSDEDNNRVRRIDAATGIITTVAGNGSAGFSGDGGPATAAQFNHPTGVAIDKNFNLYVGDYYNHRVRKVGLLDCDATGVGINTVHHHPAVVEIRPNPAEKEVVITADAIQSIAVTDVLGKTVLRQEYKNADNAILNIGSLPVGAYFVRVNGAYIGKFIKQ